MECIDICFLYINTFVGAMFLIQTEYVDKIFMIFDTSKKKENVNFL